jgi:hypothetical protein
MTEPIARIEAALARLGAEHEPPAGWEARVLAATVERKRARWWWLLPIPVAAIAVLGIVLIPSSRAPSKPALAIGFKRGEAVHRGPSMIVGDVMTVDASGDAAHRALWIYRDARLVLACPRDPRCRRADDKLIAELPLTSVGSYVIVALASRSSIPLPGGSYDEDVAAAQRAGAKVESDTVDVR